MQIIIFYYFSLALLGAIMGSFVGALTWRMKRGLNWLSGRSECEHCHHRLAPTDMIPIISYLGLGGRCRYCHKRIGRLALRLEVLTCLSFVLSGVFFPSVLEHAWRDPSITLGVACTPASLWCSSPGLAWLAFGLWLACLVLMVALFVYDLRWRKLPNRLVFPLIGFSLVYSLVTLPMLHGGGAGGWLMAVAGGMAPIAGIYGAIYLISRGKLVGLGDVKLGLA
ncbi:prepilin peptidase, partial [Candidatus Saccharibacteria bacterium]|nr:prepilin peptidase [Candidatus Saccharibacteria bacterium]